MVGDRYNQINDSVTHVIVDTLTQDIVTQLQAVSATTRYAFAATCFSLWLSELLFLFHIFLFKYIRH